MGERRGPSTLYIFAIPKPGHTTEAIRATIQEEIERLGTEGPTPEEMEKLRNTLLNDAVRSRQSTLFRAQRLAEYTLYDGDPTHFNTELERYLAVTPERIRDSVKRYLLTDNHSVMEVVPAHAADAEPAPAEPDADQTSPTSPAPRRRRFPRPRPRSPLPRPNPRSPPPNRPPRCNRSRHPRRMNERKVMSDE